MHGRDSNFQPIDYKSNDPNCCTTKPPYLVQGSFHK